MVLNQYTTLEQLVAVYSGKLEKVFSKQPNLAIYTVSQKNDTDAAHYNF